MSDDNTPDDDGPRGFGISIPMPAQIVQALAAEHDRAHMSAEDRTARVEQFIDGLDVEGLLALRTILNAGGDAKRHWAMSQYLDGQVVTLLRRVHGVNPETGRDAAAELLEAAARAGQDGGQEPPAPPA